MLMERLQSFFRQNKWAVLLALAGLVLMMSFASAPELPKELDSTGLGWSIKTIYGVGYKFETE